MSRLVFVGNGMGIAVSGVEALFVGPAHARRIDASIYKNLRCMMNGGAHDYDDFTQHRSALPSLDVWRHWQLAPYAIETCVRRLKWWLDNCCTQAASYPSGHVCFGELRCAGSNTSALDPEGVICDSAHPWARRLAHDFDELPEWIDGAAALRDMWQSRRILAFIKSDELREVFGGIDTTALRRTFLSRHCFFCWGGLR